MAAIHEEVDAMLLWRDRKILRVRHDGHAGDIDLETAGRSRICADRALDHDRCFLGEMIRLLERLFTDRLLRHDALDEAGAVAYREEVYLPARSAIVQPASERDCLTVVLRDVLNVRSHECASVRSKRCRARRASSR